MISAIARILLSPEIPNPGPLTRSLVIVRQVRPVLVGGQPCLFQFLPFAGRHVPFGVRTWINAEERETIAQCQKIFAARVRALAASPAPTTPKQVGTIASGVTTDEA